MTLFDKYNEIADSFWAKEDHPVAWCNRTIYELTGLKSEFFAFLEEVKEKYPEDRVLMAEIKQRLSQSHSLLLLLEETKDGRVKKLEAFYKASQSDLPQKKFLELKNMAGL